MLYLGWFLIFVVMVAMFVFSSMLIGPKVTTIIWVTATVVMAVLAYGFYMMMGGAL